MRKNPLKILIGLTLVALILSLVVVSVVRSIKIHESTNKEPIKYGSDGLPVDLHPKVREMLLKHQENLTKIDQEHVEITRGLAYFKSEQYQQALEHYFKAHEVTVGPKVVTAYLIAETYEKLGEYNKAVEILQKMIDEHQYSKQGEEKARLKIEEYRKMALSQIPTGPS